VEIVDSGQEIDPGRAYFAATMRQNRLFRGFTIREAADLAGISKNTVVRLESGLRIQKTSLAKLCKVFGCYPLETFPAQNAPNEGKYFRKHGTQCMLWYGTRVRADGNHEPFDPTSELTPDERQRLGRNGLAAHFGQPLRCRREGSRLIPFLIELYAPTDSGAHATGECFVYCLRGQVQVGAGDETFLLSEGEAACYDATVPNWLSPAGALEDSAPLVMQIFLP